MMGLFIALGVLGFLFLLGIILYNTLISRKNKVEYAFSGIDVQLKKRRDLIPNLIASVKEYMQHERELLTRITELRSQVMAAPDGTNQRFDLENELTRALGQLKIAVENYPDLKANTNFLQLQASLNEVEAQIAASRRAYNAAVLDYNNAIEMFPTNIIANMMNYKRKPSFELPPEERQNVDVGQLFKS